MLIYHIHDIQPGSLAVRLQLHHSFVTNWAVCWESARRHDLQAEDGQHPSVPAQRCHTSDRLGIYHKKRVKSCRHRLWHWAILADFILHHFGLGHLQAGKNFSGYERPDGQQGHDHVSYHCIPFYHHRGRHTVFLWISWHESRLNIINLQLDRLFCLYFDFLSNCQHNWDQDSEC